MLSPGSSLRKLRAFAADRPINPDKAFPSFLPDGEHFLFTHPVGDVATLQVGSIRSDETRPLVPADSRAFFVKSGFVLYVRSGTLFAQPFNPETLAIGGEPMTVVDEVDYFAPTGEAQFSVSQEGTLVFRRSEGRSQLRWFDRDGRQAGCSAGARLLRHSRISRDGRRLVAAIRDPRRSTTDLWVVDLERNVSTRLTSSPRSEWNARWSPDGSRLVFSTDWQGPPNLYIADAGGGEPRVLVPFDRTQQYAGGWTPDGSEVVYAKRSETFLRDIWAVKVATGERRSILATEFNEFAPSVSPNGQWLAYVSDASGRNEVYLRAFAEGTWQTRLSTDGGRDPVWRNDGRELFYYQPDGSIMAVQIAPGTAGAPRASLPARLFQIDARTYRSFDVAPDGQRFLIDRGVTRRALAARRGRRRLDAADEEVAPILVSVLARPTFLRRLPQCARQTLPRIDADSRRRHRAGIAQQQAAEAPASNRPFLTRPAVAGAPRPGDDRASDRVVGRTADADQGRQRLRRRRGGRRDGGAGRAGDERHRRQRLHDGVPQGEREGLVAVDGGRRAEGGRAGGDDARDAQRRDEGRHRAGQPRRLSLGARALRHDDPRRSLRARDRVRREGLSDRSDAGAVDRARPQQPREIPDDREDLPAQRRAAQGRRSAEESRLRRNAPQAGRGRAAGQSQGRFARGRHPRRLRSLLQGRHRAGVRSLLQGERRRADGRRPGTLRAAVDRAAPHALSRPRRLQQSGDFARRLRSADGRQSDRGRGSRRRRTGITRRASRRDRSDQDLEGRHLPLRRRSGVRTRADDGAAVARLRRGAPRALRSRRRPSPIPPGMPAGSAGDRATRERAGFSPRRTTRSSTRRRSPSSIGSATPSAARRRSAGSSATTSSSATPACC